MKTYQIIKRFNENTMRYRHYPEGLQLLNKVNAETETEAMESYLTDYMDDELYWNDDNTSAADCDGRVVFEKGDGAANFGDFDIIVEESEND